MKHARVIQPTNSSELSGNTLPDRSNLSKLYVLPKESRTNQEKSSTISSFKPEKTGNITINSLLVSLLLTVPLAATYLAVTYIYHETAANMENPDPLFPLLRFLVSVVWLSVCVVSLRIIVKQFYNYTMSLSVFIVTYLFFILPLVKLTYNLFPVNFVSIILTIFTWIIANYLIVLYIAWSFNRLSNKIIFLGLPILILVVCAIIL